MSQLTMFPSPVTDCVAQLSASEKSALRHLAMFRVIRVRNGWYGAEKRISLSIGKRLMQKRLVARPNKPGGSALELTYSGHYALTLLNQKARAPKVLH